MRNHSNDLNSRFIDRAIIRGIQQLEVQVLNMHRLKERKIPITAKVFSLLLSIMHLLAFARLISYEHRRVLSLFNTLGIVWLNSIRQIHLQRTLGGAIADDGQ